MAQEHIRIDGLNELIRAVGRIDKDASKELRKELKASVGGKFVTEVRAHIALKGLVRSGRLMRSIKPAVRGADLVIRSSPALNPGAKSRQGYAAVYEFGYGGRRAYMQPTRDEWFATGRLEHELDRYLNWIEEAFRS